MRLRHLVCTTRSAATCQRGQAIVLVTLSLFAMAGMMGLAVDFGWMFFLKLSAQTAADTAALGAVEEAKSRFGNNFVGFNCLNTIVPVVRRTSPICVPGVPGAGPIYFFNTTLNTYVLVPNNQ